MISGQWILVLSAALGCKVSCSSEVPIQNESAEDDTNESHVINASFSSEDAAVALSVKLQNHSDPARESWFRAHEDDAHLCPPGTERPGIEEHRKGPRPSVYSAYIPITALSTLATFLISVPCLWRLSYSGAARSLWLRSMQERFIAAAPFLIALSKALVVALIPNSWKLLFFIMSVYEALAFGCFFQLVRGFVAETWSNFEDRLAKAPPVRIWAVPPLCCIWVFCLPCMVPRVPQSRDLLIMRLLLWQFMLVIPLVALLEWLELAVPWVERLELPSLLAAMYGLFALLQMTDHVLENRRNHSKFWTLKGCIIASKVIFRIVNATPSGGIQIGSMCYTSKMLAAARAGTITAVLTVPLSCLAGYAFTAADLDVEYVPVSTEISPKPQQ